MRGSLTSIRVAWTAAAVILVLAMGAPRESVAQTPTPTPGGDCCKAHEGPGCDVAACSACVCGVDPVCCHTADPGSQAWDQICAGTDTGGDCSAACACSQTPVPTPTPGGPCCSPRSQETGGTGCDDSTCQACVCGRDPDCCNRLWDATCASEAMVECLPSCPCVAPATETPTLTPTPGGDCCAAHGGPSCDDSTCRTCVCNLDSECCNNLWDQTCTDEASVECALDCPCESTGDCCAAHDGVGCDDATCKGCVCAIDAPCCTEGQGWDADCVSEANVECAASCTCEVAGSCCEAHDTTVGCDDRRCQLCVCTLDTSCCAEGWDGTCASEAAHECQERCTGCGVSDCCDTNVQPTCSDNTCRTCVCALDDFCCNAWDATCVNDAYADCASDCQCAAAAACPGDCGGDKAVAINELISCVNIALGSAATSTCSACDVDGNGDVAINELIAAVNAALSGCPS